MSVLYCNTSIPDDYISCWGTRYTNSIRCAYWRIFLIKKHIVFHSQLPQHKMARQNHVHADCSLPMSSFSDTVTISVCTLFFRASVISIAIYTSIFSHIREYKIMPCAEQHDRYSTFYKFCLANLLAPTSQWWVDMRRGLPASCQSR
jgi:hypothetical protein